jgi:hypothetical protein
MATTPTPQAPGRQDMLARYELFNRFAMQDQKAYYVTAVANHRKASRQVNQIRALLSLATGLSAAMIGLIAQLAGDERSTVEAIIIGVLTVFAVILPAIGALFTSLADLFQWDKLIQIYDAALENLEVADAQSPHPEIPQDLIYRASLRAFAEGTLSVMSDETAQWGQAIRTPAQIEKFLQEEQKKADPYSRGFGPAPGEDEGAG